MHYKSQIATRDTSLYCKRFTTYRCLSVKRWTRRRRIGSKRQPETGRLIVSVTKHICVIDGSSTTNHDCFWGGTRCVYGYWSLGSEVTPTKTTETEVCPEIPEKRERPLLAAKRVEPSPELRELFAEANPAAFDAYLSTLILAVLKKGVALDIDMPSFACLFYQKDSRGE